MTDVFLAIAHHLLIFGMFTVVAMEIGLLRGGLSAQSVRQIARIDAGYGIMAILVVLAGVARVIWGGKGFEYYIHNIFFWLKMAAFIATGLASSPQRRCDPLLNPPAGMHRRNAACQIAVLHTL